MPSRSAEDIVERIKALEQEVYPEGINTPEIATTGDDLVIAQQSSEYANLTVTDEADIDSIAARLIDITTEANITELNADDAFVSNALSATTLSADDEIVDPAGNSISSFIGPNINVDENGALSTSASIDVRRTINQLVQQNAEQDFELGLAMLDFDDGQYEVFADDTNVSETTDVSVTYGSGIDDSGYVELASDATEGTVTHVLQDMVDFVPNTAVVVEELEAALPDGADISYEIIDNLGNSETISRDQLDSEVTLETIESYEVAIRAILSRDDTSTTSPQLDGYSVYFTGSVPQEYVKATVDSTSEAY